ncbi:unnamed protein product [Symbiodinium sp. CCMP2592]|nr:unnamed protein product [Symbiodinium sp. CCMP2592]
MEPSRESFVSPSMQLLQGCGGESLTSWTHRTWPSSQTGSNGTGPQIAARSGQRFCGKGCARRGLAMWRQRASQRLCLTWTRCASLGQLWTALEGWGYLITPAARLVLYKPPHWKVHCGISGILWKYVSLGVGRWNCRPKELQRPFLDHTKASKKKSEQEGLHLPSWLRDKVRKSRCAPHSQRLPWPWPCLEVAGIDPKLFEEELRPKTGLDWTNATTRRAQVEPGSVRDGLWSSVAPHRPGFQHGLRPCPVPPTFLHSPPSATETWNMKGMQ